VFSIGLGIGANATILHGEPLRPAARASQRSFHDGIDNRRPYGRNPSALMDRSDGRFICSIPTWPVYNAETMEEHVRTAYFLPHLAAMLFGTFGLIGLVLAIVGLYGVMSYAVSRRTRRSAFA